MVRVHVNHHRGGKKGRFLMYMPQARICECGNQRNRVQKSEDYTRIICMPVRECLYAPRSVVCINILRFPLMNFNKVYNKVYILSLFTHFVVRKASSKIFTVRRSCGLGGIFLSRMDVDFIVIVGDFSKITLHDQHCDSSCQLADGE